MPSSDSSADAPQRQLAHGAGEPALILDVAADDQDAGRRDRQRYADGEAGAAPRAVGARA